MQKKLAYLNFGRKFKLIKNNIVLEKRMQLQKGDQIKIMNKI